MSAPSSNPNSNKFRAEPFVNLTAESLSIEGSNGNGTSGNNSRRPSAAFSVADGTERDMIQDEHDELMEDEDEDEERADSVIPSSRMRTRIPNRGDSNRQSLSSGPYLHTASSISDLQRASIASTTSSTSSARRSSYDPNEPGVLEKIHTGQGKSKRKPISVQQWKHMTTFKIRPPTATEAASSATNTSVPTPVSVDPHQQYSPPSSATPDRKMDMDTGFVFIPEGGSANAISVAPPIPRAVPIVMPPTTLTYGTGSGASNKPPRKRVRREEPNDPNIQVFYHDDFAPTTVLYSERGHSVEPPPTPPPHHLTSTSQLIPETDNMHVKTPSPPLAAAPTPPLPTLPPVPQQVFKSQPIPTTTTTPIMPPTSHHPVKYDSAEQVFTLPETEPFERGGPPPRKWTSVYREVKTIGGSSWTAATWVSEGEPAVPADPPTGFIPGPLAHSSSGGIGFGFGFGSSAGNSVQGLNALSGLSSLALGMGGGLGSKGTGTGTATPTLGTPGGLVAPVKRVKKVKSDASIGGGGRSATPSVAGGGGGRKKPATGAATAKRGKKGTGTPGTATPVLMEPPLVAITRAVSDTVMRDA